MDKKQFIELSNPYKDIMNTCIDEVPKYGLYDLKRRLKRLREKNKNKRRHRKMGWIDKMNNEFKKAMKSAVNGKQEEFKKTWFSQFMTIDSFLLVYKSYIFSEENNE